MKLDKEKVLDLLEGNGFAKWIGIEILEVEEGYARGRIRVESHHLNLFDGMHGGCSYALADTLAGIAASTYGNYVTTIDGKMNYLLPMKDTEYVNCEAKVVRQGGRIGVYETKFTNDSGEVMGTAEFTYYRTSEKIEKAII